MGDPQETTKLEKFSQGTVDERKFVISEADGTTPTLEFATWQLLDALTFTLTLSGDAIVDNADVDKDGTAVRTVQVNIDLTGSTSYVGFYWLVIHLRIVDADPAEDAQFRVPVEILDYSVRGN
jgi:hypothetical protein